VDILIKKPDTLDLKSKVLLAQSYNKLDSFEKSVNLYVDLLLNHSLELGEDYEDVVSNFLNSLSWLIWTNNKDGSSKSFEIGENEKKALEEVSEY